MRLLLHFGNVTSLPGLEPSSLKSLPKYVTLGTFPHHEQPLALRVCPRFAGVDLQLPVICEGKVEQSISRASVLFLMEGCLHGAGRMLLVAFRKCAFSKSLVLAEDWFGVPGYL